MGKILFPYKDFIVAAVIFGALAPATGAFAMEECQKAAKPQISAQLASQQQANAEMTVMTEYFESVSAYTQCLAAYAKANKDTLAKAEQKEIKKAYKDAQKEMKAVAREWNKTYTKYLKQARKS